MTARRTWKKRESNVADFFQGQRTPLSGGNSKVLDPMSFMINYI